MQLCFNVNAFGGGLWQRGVDGGGGGGLMEVVVVVTVGGGRRRRRRLGGKGKEVTVFGGGGWTDETNGQWTEKKLSGRVLDGGGTNEKLRSPVVQLKC